MGVQWSGPNLPKIVLTNHSDLITISPYWSEYKLSHINSAKSVILGHNCPKVPIGPISPDYLNSCDTEVLGLFTSRIGSADRKIIK
jgi:hypothetical protein